MIDVSPRDTKEKERREEVEKERKKQDESGKTLSRFNFTGFTGLRSLLLKGRKI
jgi:hypothetical protein